jgi:hypothetical protein
MTEYQQYLDRMQKLISMEIVPKTAIFDYFTKHLYERDEDPHSVEPLLWYIQSGLYSDLTFSIYRLFDKNGDRNIYHFTHYAQQHKNTIPWKTPLVASDFARHEKLLADIFPKIENLRKRRNKFFAHYSKKFFYEPDKINEEFPFSNTDAMELVRVLQKIISDHTMALNNSAAISVEGFVYAAAESLYQAIKKGKIPEQQA